MACLLRDQEIKLQLCPICELWEELCAHCGKCVQFCDSDEVQRDFESERKPELAGVTFEKTSRREARTDKGEWL